MLVSSAQKDKPQPNLQVTEIKLISPQTLQKYEFFPVCKIEKGIRFGNRTTALNDGNAIITDDKEACAQHSLMNARALFWTYNPKRGKCWLKSSDSGRREDPKVVSGNRECGLGEFVKTFAS